MSSNKINSIKQGAIIVANDLRTGTSVYLTSENKWSESITQAVVVRSDLQAEGCLAAARAFEDAAIVLDPYLVQTDTNGVPVHIREQIRAAGPSIGTGTVVPVTRAAG